MPTRRQLIQKIELNSNQSSVTFSGIPQNYTDLKIVTSTRLTTGDFWMGLQLNDSTSNFTYRQLQGNGSSASSPSGTGMTLFLMSENSSYTANTFSSGEAYFPNYSGSSYKSFRTISVLENNATASYMTVVSGLWSNTSAITSMNLYAYSGSTFAAGSTFYLYGITHVPIIRGGEEYVSGGFKYHKFTSTAALQVIEPGDVEYLVVAGGGAGGNGNYSGGGGGGAGGMTIGRTRLPNSIHTITVAGGGAGTNFDGNSGSNSSIASLITSSGGGGGGGNVSTAPSPGRVGLNGGSGGGASGSQTGVTGGTGTSGQGNNGGGSIGSSVDPNPIAGGGGGGAAAAGSTATTSNNLGGNGGIGSIWPSGSTSYYSGGGGGGKRLGGTSSLGGAGGGGAGGQGTSASTFAGQAAQFNTGGGGGGSGGSSGVNTSGANGGSGIVIIRYPYDGN